MSRKNRTLEERERRAKIRELLKESNISSMEDIQDLSNLENSMKKKAKYGAKGAQMTVKITKAIKKSAGVNGKINCTLFRH